MGCAMPRADMTAEEATSHNLDLLLGYSSVPITRYFEAHHNNTQTNLVNEEQFQKIKSKSGIFIKNPEHAQQISNFYSRLKEDLLFYNSKKLSDLAILLCAGSDDQKASFLFKNHKKAERETLEKNELIEIFEGILEIPVLIVTVIQVKDEVNQLTQADLRRFALKLKSGKENALKMIVDKILAGRDEIDEQGFIEGVKNELPSQTLTAVGIRKILKNHPVIDE
jgi:hypothetical protein